MKVAAILNTMARSFIVWGMKRLAPYAHRKAMSEVTNFKQNQHRLKLEYQITPNTPCRLYDEELRKTISELPNVEWVKTSGSTKEPKIIAFDRSRLANVKKSFAGVTLRSADSFDAQRPIVFTLASLADDESFTAIMTNKEPSQFDLWVTPHRALAINSVRKLTETYSVHALRIWGIVLSNPGWLYSTNPSTQAGFFHALSQEWDTHLKLLRDYFETPEQFSTDIHRVAAKIVTTGWRERGAVLLNSARPLKPTEWLNIEAYCSWDGGNTAPFLRQLEGYLPDIQFIPMFSMSTETLETLTVYDNGTPHFVTIAPNVLYEFLPEGAEDDPTLLLSGWDLCPGERYVMVVSDPYGLRRYVTEDVFLCKELFHGVPDLRFLHRRGLTWSYTGEKITGEQLAQVYEQLAERFTELREVQMTTIPSHPSGRRLPGYALYLTTPGNSHVDTDLETPSIAACFDTFLSEVNDEYASKRHSSRLHSPEAIWIPFDVLAARLRGEEADTQNREWDSQFKLLPLLRKTVQDLNL